MRLFHLRQKSMEAQSPRNEPLIFNLSLASFLIQIIIGKQMHGKIPQSTGSACLAV
jgi:hypothetical protein